MNLQNSQDACGSRKTKRLLYGNCPAIRYKPTYRWRKRGICVRKCTWTHVWVSRQRNCDFWLGETYYPMVSDVRKSDTWIEFIRPRRKRYIKAKADHRQHHNASDQCFRRTNSDNFFLCAPPCLLTPSLVIFIRTNHHRRTLSWRGSASQVLLYVIHTKLQPTFTSKSSFKNGHPSRQNLSDRISSQRLPVFSNSFAEFE